ncbi:hypothetical protein G3I24_12810 [Micromonospora aurantiaca]|nr:hypothetical protein [Micromonospora aurantiaca]
MASNLVPAGQGVGAGKLLAELADPSARSKPVGGEQGRLACIRRSNNGDETGSAERGDRRKVREAECETRPR